MQSWYSQNLKKMNNLMGKLTEYSMVGSFDTKLDLKEVIDVLRRMAEEINSLQNQAVEKEKLIGLLKMQISDLSSKKVESTPVYKEETTLVNEDHI
jgi:hypothetical protein